MKLASLISLAIATANAINSPFEHINEYVVMDGHTVENDHVSLLPHTWVGWRYTGFTMSSLFDEGN